MNLKKQIILFLASCLIVAFVMIWLFIIPLLGSIKQISFSLVETKKELAIIHNGIGEVGGAESICNKIDPDLQKMEKLFVDGDVPVGAIELLEDTATASDLSIDISPAFLDGYEDEAWDFVVFRLSLRGSYSNFVKFLEKTETGSFLIESYDLSIKRISGETESLKSDINAILIIKVFAR